MPLIGVALALMLGGCATEAQLLKGSGIEVPPPVQWQDLCDERPYLEICRPAVIRL